MKQFSEYFADYMKNTNLTWTEASNRCGVDRTLLSRYASGKKLPESAEKVSIIAEGLGMTKQERKEIQMAYECSKTGGYQFGVLNLLEQIFFGKTVWQKPEPSVNWDEIKWEQEKACTRRLCGREEIDNAIRALAREASILRIHMNYNELLNDICYDCKIQHLIELDSTGARESEVEEIKQTLPLLYFGKNYKIYCHYRKYEKSSRLEDRISMILSDKGLILFSEDRDRGIYTCAANYMEYYGQIFKNDLKRCHVFGSSGCISDAYIEKQGENALLEHPESGICFYYQQLPCERIWVWQNGVEGRGFYLEESQLVKIFSVFRKMHQKQEEEEEEGEEAAE